MGGVTGATSTGAATAGSAFNNPALLSILLPNVNLQQIQTALEVPITEAEQPIEAITTQTQTLNTQVSDWQTLQNDVEALQQAAQALEQDPTGGGQAVYQQISATSSDSNQVSVTASGQPGVAGTYVIGPASGQSAIVLAQNEIVDSAAQSSGGTALGLSGSFSINGQTVAVTAGDSLSQIAADINSLGAGVSAAVMAPPGGQYVLSIQGNDAAPISFSDPNGVLAGLGVLGSSGTPNVVQAAQYAQYSVNGVSVTQGTSNTDSTSIPGASFTLQGTGGATLTLLQNNAAVTSGVQSLVSSVNQLLSDLSTYGGKGGALEGDATLLTLQSAVEQAFGAVLAGNPAGYQAGSQIGLSLTAPVGSPNDLTASLASGSFSTAYGSDPGAVQTLLGGSDGLATQLDQALGTFAGASGAIQQTITGIQQQVTTLGQETSNPESALNQAVDFAQQQAQQEYQRLLSALVAQQQDSGMIDGLMGQMSQIYGASSGSSGSSGGSSGGA